MEDIIQKYKRERKMRNIAIVITSLTLAFGLNLFLSTTESGKYLKSSVINSTLNSEEKADLYVDGGKNTGNTIFSITSSQEMSQVKSMSFSVAYNKENVSLKDSNILIEGIEMIPVWENNGYLTLMLNFTNPINIQPNDKILQLVFEKINSQEIESINLLNANMTDAEGSFFWLSTSGIEF